MTYDFFSLYNFSVYKIILIINSSSDTKYVKSPNITQKESFLKYQNCYKLSLVIFKIRLARLAALPPPQIPADVYVGLHIILRKCFRIIRLVYLFSVGGKFSSEKTDTLY